MTRKVIVHFSQDFRAGKVQLGGFSRIYKLCGDGNKHIIFTISNKDEELIEFVVDHIQVIQFPLRVKKFSRLVQLRTYRSIAKKIFGYLEEKGIVPDLFFGHSQLFNFWILHQLKRKYYKRRALIWEANVIWGVLEVSGVKGKIANFMNRAFQKRVFALADCVIAQTNSSRSFISSEFGINCAKIRVITNAMDSGSVKVNRRIERFKKADLKILCLGLFDEMNGIPFLLSFINCNDLAGMSFTFIGDGKYRLQVEKLAETGKCKYLGSIRYIEMQKKYQEFEFVIIPRLKRIEADLFLPTKLIEAMYFGLIPICSNVEAMKTVIEHENNGYLFEAGNGQDFKRLLSFIKNEDYLRLVEISKNAECTIKERYLWDENYKILNAVYNEQCANSTK